MIPIYVAEDDLEFLPPASVSKVSWGNTYAPSTAFQTVILMVRRGVWLLGSKLPPFSAHTHLNFLKASCVLKHSVGRFVSLPEKFW